MLFVSCHKQHNDTAAAQSSNAKSAVNSTTLSDPQAIIDLYKEVDSLTRVGSMDRKKMQQFVDESVEYAKKVPSDTLSPHFLLYAGVMQMQVAFSNADEQQRVKQAEAAIDILEKLRQNYPDYRNAIYAYYYKAQIYENLGKREEAEKSYHDLVDRFPDTELGKNIASYLKADGYEKTADEIYQGFRR